MAQNTYIRPLTVGGAPIGVRTASFNTDSFVNNDSQRISITAIVSAVTGTSPTMAAKLQWSPDGGTTWVDVETANAVTPNLAAAGNASFHVGPGLTAAAAAASNRPVPRLLRVAVTIGGTSPNYTFTGIYANGSV